MAPTKERIAEIRAAWAVDRQERREAFRRDWFIHLAEFVKDAGLGVTLGLSGSIWLLYQAGGF